MRSPLSTRARAVIIALAGCVWLETACTEIGREQHDKALGVSRGATEAELIHTAGPPTQKVEPAEGHCRDAGGAYELVYEVRVHYLGGWHRDSSSSAVAFCIDSMSKVVESVMIEY